MPSLGGIYANVSKDTTILVLMSLGHGSESSVHSPEYSYGSCQIAGHE